MSLSFYLDDGCLLDRSKKQADRHGQMLKNHTLATEALSDALVAQESLIMEGIATGLEQDKCRFCVVFLTPLFKQCPAE
jgi:hypothetical protein